MPLNIRSETVNELADTLAARLKISKTEAVKQALLAELSRLDQTLSLIERIRPIQNDILSRPRTGLAADTAFFDELSGNS
nr:type II toxin-antitoxin system VapB family antitoxin [uncultured Rhodopila sp.]